MSFSQSQALLPVRVEKQYRLDPMPCPDGRKPRNRRYIVVPAATLAFDSAESVRIRNSAVAKLAGLSSDERKRLRLALDEVAERDDELKIDEIKSAIERMTSEQRAELREMLDEMDAEANDITPKSNIESDRGRALANDRKRIAMDSADDFATRFPGAARIRVMI